MRVVEIRSAPKQCPECGSKELGGHIDGWELGGCDLLCYDCGLLIQLNADLEEPAEVGLSATLHLCPHCSAAGEIVVRGGEEWCRSCGLDPGNPDYPTASLAHLWTEGSGIRRIMEEGRSLLGPKRKLGRLLRTKCGPHCNFGKGCPQETGNLIKCYGEEYPTSERDMSKKSRRVRRREHRSQRKAIRKNQSSAVLLCAGSGWFEKVMYANSPHPQQTGSTGSGSGT